MMRGMFGGCLAQRCANQHEHRGDQSKAETEGVSAIRHISPPTHFRKSNSDNDQKEQNGKPIGIGILTTRTLVISGEGGQFTTPGGQRGAMLRAYNKATGEEVGAVYMPGAQTGSPMTYMAGGKQYIVLAISGAGYSGELIAFRLPSES